jgi:polar amino acid transport system substrate-binding protein
LSSPTDTSSLKSNGGVGSTAGSAVVFFVVVLALSSMVVSPLAMPASAQQAAVTNPLSGRADVIDEGRSLFNQYCAHCHGTNAYQGERSRDLRRLSLRYGAQAPRVFYETATNGKLDKGMPVWKTVLSDDALWQIFTFLETVQTPP